MQEIEIAGAVEETPRKLIALRVMSTRKKTPIGMIVGGENAELVFVVKPP
jgi:hypothetical protein